MVKKSLPKKSKKQSQDRQVKRQRMMDIIVVIIAIVLITLGLLALQRRAANERRAEAILLERQKQQAAADEAVQNPCATTGQNYDVVIKGDDASPETLTIKKCDKITLKNADPSLTYNMNFGEHSEHLEYVGFEARDLTPGQTQTITATTTGEYLLHDHYQDGAHIHITIAAQ